MSLQFSRSEELNNSLYIHLHVWDISCTSIQYKYYPYMTFTGLTNTHLGSSIFVHGRLALARGRSCSVPPWSEPSLMGGHKNQWIKILRDFVWTWYFAVMTIRYQWSNWRDLWIFGWDLYTKPQAWMLIIVFWKGVWTNCFASISNLITFSNHQELGNDILYMSIFRALVGLGIIPV